MLDVEAQVISLVGEMEAGARDRVLTYLQARYQSDQVEGTKVARKDNAARVARATPEVDAPVNVPTAAKITRVSKPVLYSWIKRGKLKTMPGDPNRGSQGRPEMLVSVAAIRALQEE